MKLSRDVYHHLICTPPCKIKTRGYRFKYRGFELAVVRKLYPNYDEEETCTTYWHH